MRCRRNTALTVRTARGMRSIGSSPVMHMASVMLHALMWAARCQLGNACLLCSSLHEWQHQCGHGL